MNLQPLSLHRDRFESGKPTPFAIFDVGGRLLLARGHRFESMGQLEKLIDRDARVDAREFEDRASTIAQARQWYPYGLSNVRKRAQWVVSPQR